MGFVTLPNAFEADAFYGLQVQDAGGPGQAEFVAELLRLRVQRDDRAAVAGSGQFCSQRAVIQSGIDESLVFFAGAAEITLNCVILIH